MKPTKLFDHIVRHVQQREPVVITGAPGGGKSDLMRQVAAHMELPLIEFRAANHTREDLTGLVWPKDGKTVFLSLGLLPDVERDGDSGIIFIDEIFAADQPLQKGLMQFCLPPHCVAGYQLPPGWSIVAAGNRASDRAGVGAINSALANRFAHFEMDTDSDSWIRWAAQNGVSPELMAFIRFRPALLHAFDPNQKVNPSPRTWTKADKMRQTCPDAESELETLTAYVGEGPAAEFFAFLKVWRTMPNPDAVLTNPDASNVPPESTAVFALCGALARKVTEQTIAALTRYLERIPAEYGILCMQHAVALRPELEQTRELIEWRAKHSDLYT